MTQPEEQRVVDLIERELRGKHFVNSSHISVPGVYEVCRVYKKSFWESSDTGPPSFPISSTQIFVDVVYLGKFLVWSGDKDKGGSWKPIVGKAKTHELTDIVDDPRATEEQIREARKYCDY